MRSFIFQTWQLDLIWAEHPRWLLLPERDTEKLPNTGEILAGGWWLLSGGSTRLGRGQVRVEQATPHPPSPAQPSTAWVESSNLHTAEPSLPTNMVTTTSFSIFKTDIRL